MNFHGASAVQQAQQEVIISDERHREKLRSTEGSRSREPESPTLAGYIVYVVTVVGFLIMCVSAALR